MSRIGSLLLCLFCHSALPTFAQSGSESCRDRRSLTFVIDTTGSMGDDIAQVCQQTRLIADELSRSASRNLYRHFVLVPFNDPTYGPATTYSSAGQLTAASCALRASGGEDCPEMTFSGLLIALEETCPQSTIYIFTDASAKDLPQLGRVLEVLERKQIRVVFFLSGSVCGGQFQAYQTIATRSGGQLFFISKNEVGQILSFVRRTLSSQPSGTLLFQRTGSSSWRSAFQVLPGTSALSVSVSCERSRPQVTVTSPSRADRGTISTTGRSYLASFSNPTAGRWSLQVRSASSCTVSVTASSSLSQAFSYYFGQRTGLLRSSTEARTRPVEGTNNYLYVSVPRGATLSNVELVNARGQVLLNLPASRVAWRSGNVIALGPFIPPNQSFFINFVGSSNSGAAFRESSTTSVTAEAGEIFSGRVQSVIAHRCGELKVTCSIRQTNGEKVPITWTHNGSNLSPDGDRVKVEGTLSERIVINPVWRSDTGLYRCLPAVDIGPVSTSALRVYVQEPPFSVTDECNYCQLLSCPASPVVQWTHNGVSFTSLRDRYQVFPNGTARVCLPLGERAGIYTCRTTSGYSWSFTISTAGRVFTGNWTGIVRESASTCPSLPQLVNGEISYSSERRAVNSVARLSCRQGYTLQGQSEVRCLSTGFWSAATAVCEARVAMCSGLSLPTNGRIQFLGINRLSEPTGVTFPQGTRAIYSCFPGHQLIGERELRCLSSGVWSSAEPRCEGIRCPSLNAFSNGRQSSSNNQVGSSIFFTCNPGYRLSGASRIDCLSSGSWSNVAPTCIIAQCPSLGAFSNGRRSSSNNQVGSSISFTCNPGYRLTGASRITCLSSGLWSNVGPTCIIAQCPSLGAFSNGRRSSSNNQVGSSISFTCNPGYRLSGASRITCLSSGLWSNVLPTCIIAQCPSLGAFSNGRRSSSNNQVGSSISFTCNPGYRLSGASRINCLSSGLWSNVAPTCIIIRCQWPRNPTNGRFTGRNNRYLSAISYQCNDGYQLIGAEQRWCLANESWSAVPPRCEPACPELPELPNTVITYSPLRLRTVGSTVRYGCAVGHRLVNIDLRERRCQPNRRWSGVASGSVCTRTTCPNLPPPDNGHVQHPEPAYTAAQALYRCNPTYELRPSSSQQRVCNLNGSWSGQQPLCTALQCAAPRFPANGLLIGSSYAVNQTVRYRCDDGYQLFGAQSRICQMDQTWSGREPRCQVACPALPLRNNTIIAYGSGGRRTVGSIARLSCVSGYRLINIVPPQIRCLPNRRWSGVAHGTICQRVQCPTLTTPAHGQVNFPQPSYPGSQAVYTCSATYGIEPSSSQRRDCLPDGSWSGREPTCEALQCPGIFSFTNGRVIGNTFNVNSSIFFQCNSGYQLIGAQQLRCQVDQTWDSALPRCEVACPPLESRPNTVVTYTPLGRRTIGATGRYGCVQGYRLVDVSRGAERRCQPNRRWSGVAQIQICTRITCDDLEAPQFGQVSLSSRLPGGTATYTCFTPFDLQPASASTRVCQDNGTWSGEAPTCEAKPCGIPEDIMNGEVTYSGVSMGSRAQYSCNLGYRSNGVSSGDRLCLPTGVWSGSAMTCEVISCPMPTPPVNGEMHPGEDAVVVNGNQLRYRSMVEMSCSDGYRMKMAGDSSSVMCDLSGTWNMTEMVCEPMPCPSPGVSLNAEYVGNDYSMGSTVTYHCKPGYRSNEQMTLRCLSGGVWDREPPECQAIDCGALPRISNGSCTSSSTLYGASATCRCKHDCFQLSASGSMHCTESGRWSRAPQCQVKSQCKTPIRSLVLPGWIKINSSCMRLPCTADLGYPAAQVTWSFNGQAIPRNVPLMTYLSDGSLQVCNLSPALHAGTYQCSATNVMGSVSKSVTLNSATCAELWMHWLQRANGDLHTQIQTLNNRIRMLQAEMQKKDKQCNDDKRVIAENLVQKDIELSECLGERPTRSTNEAQCCQDLKICRRRTATCPPQLA